MAAGGNRRMIDGNGTMRFFPVSNTTGVQPTLYLNSNIKITSGDGSSDNPYRLSI